MNVKELNEMVKNNQKEELEKTIKEIEKYIVSRGSRGFNNFKVSTSKDYKITIKEWMISFLREYFEDNGYKVEVKEIKTITRGIEKLLGIYDPGYLMTISWEEV